MLDTVLARIKALDFAVLRDLHELAATDLASVAALLADLDPEIRELALLVLDEVGGLPAARAAAAAVMDENPQVVSVALRILRHHATPEVLEQVQGDFAMAQDPIVRRHLALVLGRIGASCADVLALEQSENDPETKDTLLLVAAHLGDRDARARAPVRWSTFGARSAQHLIEDLEFLAAAWALPELRAFLGDTTPVLRIGADGLPGPEYLRVCDLTVNLAARLGPPPFPFPTDGKTNYENEQLRQTGVYLDGLARA
jgi:HEAT repeat protein